MRLGVVVTLFLGAVAAGCGLPQLLVPKPVAAVNSTMTEAEKADLKKALADLESTLKEHAPFVQKELAPPATDEELARLRSGLGGAQVDALEVWYQWHNGGSASYSYILWPYGRVISISEALRDRDVMKDIPLVDAKRRGALKLVEDGSGDGLFLDVASPKPRVFSHWLEDGHPIDYGTMLDFVQFVARIHAAGLASLDERGNIDYDLDEYVKLDAEYRAGLKSP